MAPYVIDLTDSPEPEESPARAAATALRGFQPRPEKQGGKKQATQSRAQNDNGDARVEGENAQAPPSYKGAPLAPAALKANKAAPPAGRQSVKGTRLPQITGRPASRTYGLEGDARNELRGVRAGQTSSGSEKQVSYEVPLSFRTPPVGARTNGNNSAIGSEVNANDSSNGRLGIGTYDTNPTSSITGASGVPARMNGSSAEKPRTLAPFPSAAAPAQESCARPDPRESHDGATSSRGQKRPATEISPGSAPSKDRRDRRPDYSKARPEDKPYRPVIVPTNHKPSFYRRATSPRQTTKDPKLGLREPPDRAEAYRKANATLFVADSSYRQTFKRARTNGPSSAAAPEQSFVIEKSPLSVLEDALEPALPQVAVESRRRTASQSKARQPASPHRGRDPDPSTGLSKQTVSTQLSNLRADLGQIEARRQNNPTVDHGMVQALGAASSDIKKIIQTLLPTHPELKVAVDIINSNLAGLASGMVADYFARNPVAQQLRMLNTVTAHLERLVKMDAGQTLQLAPGRPENPIELEEAPATVGTPPVRTPTRDVIQLDGAQSVPRSNPASGTDDINPRSSKRQRMLWPESPSPGTSRTPRSKPAVSLLSPAAVIANTPLHRRPVVSDDRVQQETAPSVARAKLSSGDRPVSAHPDNDEPPTARVVGATTPQTNGPAQRRGPFITDDSSDDDNDMPTKRPRLQNKSTTRRAERMVSDQPAKTAQHTRPAQQANASAKVIAEDISKPPIREPQDADVGESEKAVFRAPTVTDGISKSGKAPHPDKNPGDVSSSTATKRKAKRTSAAAVLAANMDFADQGPAASTTTRMQSPLRSNAFQKGGVASEAITPDKFSTPKASSSRSSDHLWSVQAPLTTSTDDVQSILQARALAHKAIERRQSQSQVPAPEPLQRPVSGQPAQPAALQPDVQGDSIPGAHGSQYTPEEDALIIQLKEMELLSWEEIAKRLPHRTYGSIQVRYSTKLKHRAIHKSSAVAQRKPLRVSDIGAETGEDSDGAPRARRKRNNGASTVDGFISWTDVKAQRLLPDTQDDEASAASQIMIATDGERDFAGEHAYPKPISRILRQREFGTNAGRGDEPSTRSIPTELKDHVFDDVGPRKFFKGTSSDVTCLAWASDGRRFAAGSIAITDAQSMQYNKPNNLLIGDHEQSLLVELPEHHLPRPRVDESGNANGLHSMQETQDPRLFMTVASVQFSPDGHILYSAGSDCKVRAYEYDRGIERARCNYALDHQAPLDLMSVGNHGVVATACHQNTDSCIGVYDNEMRSLSLGATRADSQVDRAIYPSALRWGAAARHSNFLLAGFSIDSIDEERDMAGETCLYDIVADGRRIELNSVTRNVFDVAWNPSASSASHLFAIASTPGTSKVSKGTRSIVQCFAPNQNRAKRVLELECPAFDINDIIYCPWDDNLIAVGATDGKVYLWDQRYTTNGHKPLHILEHGASLSVLDHDRAREVADTGIRFLSWGATSSRLYSGSSDGVVKIWNPYMSTSTAHVKDIATFTSAVMSGAFSPDYRELLIGEDQGRINLLSVGYGEKTVRSMQRFDFKAAPTPQTDNDARPEGHVAARELVNSGQIAIKRMGAFPIRQAVQGDNYRGPYLAPTTREVQEADDALRSARDEQHTVHTQAAITSATMLTEDEATTAAKAAEKKVDEAYQKMEDLQRRQADAAALEPKAIEIQLAFRAAYKSRRNSLSKQERRDACKLDCNYLPALNDDDAGAPDSDRARDRIPTALWPAQDVDVASATPADLVEAGLTSKCMTCLGPAEKPKPGKMARCQSCVRKAQGYTASCDICASPIRPAIDTTDGRPKRCERCSFACFRCGKSATTLINTRSVTCEKCERTWKVGALGYELIKSQDSDAKSVMKLHKPRIDAEDEERRREHFGLAAIEHYASKWE